MSTAWRTTSWRRGTKPRCALLKALPRGRRPEEIRTEADSVAEVVDRRDMPGRETPLHLAVHLGDVAAAEILMAAGADWSLQNEQGWSALQEAIYAREESLVRVIVHHYQPLAWAKWCRRLPRVVATIAGLLHGDHLPLRDLRHPVHLLHRAL